MSHGDISQALATVLDDELVDELTTTAQIFLSITIIRVAYDAYVRCFFRAEVSHPLYSCREVFE